MIKKTSLIFASMLVAVIVVSLICIWQYLNQPIPQAEVFLRTTQGEKASVDFSLPRGNYIVKAVLQGEPINEDISRKIGYKITIPIERVNFGDEKDINFSNKLKEVWLKSFEIKDNNSKGALSAEVIVASKSVIEMKIQAIKQVLFKTVE